MIAAFTSRLIFAKLKEIVSSKPSPFFLEKRKKKIKENFYLQEGFLIFFCCSFLKNKIPSPVFESPE